jgi:hypothetical protein
VGANRGGSSDEDPVATVMGAAGCGRVPPTTVVGHRRVRTGTDRGGPPHEDPVAVLMGATGHKRAPTGVGHQPKIQWWR